jgi:hypothetical protein
MTLLYLMTVGAPYFIRGGMGQDFKNGPPPTFFGLLRGPLTLALMPSLSLALLLGLSPSLLRLSFLFGLPLSFTPLRFLPMPLGRSLLLSLYPRSLALGGVHLVALITLLLGLSPTLLRLSFLFGLPLSLTPLRVTVL